jgi:hypothetical protein
MAAQVYEAKGGSYENQEGSKNEPKKGAPEPKDKAKKAAGKKTGQVCVSDRSWFRNLSLQPLKELGGHQAQAHERRLRALVLKQAQECCWSEDQLRACFVLCRCLYHSTCKASCPGSHRKGGLCGKRRREQARGK